MVYYSAVHLLLSRPSIVVWKESFPLVEKHGMIPARRDSSAWCTRKWLLLCLCIQVCLCLNYCQKWTRIFGRLSAVASLPSEADHNQKPLLVRMFMSNLKGPTANVAKLLVKKGLVCFKEGLDTFLICCCNVTCHIHLPLVCNCCGWSTFISSVNFCFHRPKTEDAITSGNESVVWDPPLDPSLAASDVDATSHEVTIEHKKEVLKHEVTLKLPAQLKDLLVRVSHVNSPSSFYVQLTQHLAQLSRSADTSQLLKGFITLTST